MKLRNKKTGEIGYLIVGRGSDHYVVANNEWSSCGKYDSLAELNEEWEDYEEPKEYWFVSEHQGVYSAYDYGNLISSQRKEIGNYFDTREDAEKAVEKLKAWKRLKDKNFHFLKYSALGCGEIEFSLDFEDMDDEGEIGELRHDLELLFGGEDE